MIKRGFIWLCFILGIFFIIPLVSSEIYINNINGVYNIGDEVEANIDILSNFPIAEHLYVDLICGNKTRNIYNNYIKLNIGEEKSVLVRTFLEEEFFQNSSNVCGIKAKHGESVHSSDTFRISRAIEVETEPGISKYNPGSYINITGKGIRESGNSVEGFLIVSVESVNISFSERINNGSFNFSLKLPENIASGKHIINLMAYETGKKGNTTNKGDLNMEIEVLPRLTKLEINVVPVNVIPGNEFTYSVNVYDQANNLMKEKIGTTFYNPDSHIYLKKLVDSGREYKLILGINETQGYWNIEAVVGNAKIAKLFYLEGFKKISSNLSKGVLTITNVGNIPYQGPIEVIIGSKAEIVNLDLKIGESKKMKLYAPKGNYTIGVNDGENPLELGTSFLTGSAIRVGGSDVDFTYIASSPLFWIVFMILLALVILYIIVKIRLKKSKEPVTNGKEIFGNKSQNFSNFKKDESIPLGNSLKHLGTHGFKEKAVVIGIRAEGLKNSSRYSELMRHLFGDIKRKGAKIYEEGNYYIVLLSESLTKMKENVSSAIQTAKEMNLIIEEHNRKFREKIDFGIGINSGEIISEINFGKFKFTSLGGLISSVKRIAQYSESKVLISDEAKKTISEKIKISKYKNTPYWEIKEVVDRSKYDKFIKGFMKRNE